MQRFVRRFFDVREGEGIRALQAAASIFALLSAHTMLETARDTLAWAREEGPPGPKDVGVAMAPAGISRERERELLDAWRRDAA